MIQYLSNKIRALLVGPPGCGKTARIAAAAKSANMRLMVVRASLSERVDFGGALVPDVEAGITRALPLEFLADLQTTKIPTLLFLDDLGQAPVDVQSALMRLFDEGALSPEVLIWGATNRPGDKAGVTALCEPLRSRFHLAFAVPTPSAEDKADGPVLLGNWKEEVDGWCDWCLSTYPDAVEAVAWHRSPHLGATHAVGPVLYGWKPHADPALRMPDFRSWEVVSRLLSLGIRDLDSVAAAIGKGQAAAFLSFCALAGQLPDPQQIWMDPMGAPVPSEAGALCFTATRLGSAVEPKFAGAFCKYIGRMPQIFAALSAKDAYKRLGAKLSANKDWQKWFTDNQELFTAR